VESDSVIHGTTLWSIQDLASLNGLTVNNIKVAEAELRDGDSVVIGQCRDLEYIFSSTSAGAGGDLALCSLRKVQRNSHRFSSSIELHVDDIRSPVKKRQKGPQA